jgi:hypothetical protein
MSHTRNLQNPSESNWPDDGSTGTEPCCLLYFSKLYVSVAFQRNMSNNRTQNKALQTTWQQALPEFCLLLFFMNVLPFKIFGSEFNAFQNNIITNLKLCFTNSAMLLRQFRNIS